MTSVRALVDQKADLPVSPPPQLPALTAQRPEVNNKEHRYSYTPVYPGMQSNIDARIMAYTKEPFPVFRDPITNEVIDGQAFRDSEVIREWVESLVDRKGYRHKVEYNTTVELAEKEGSKWILTLRKSLPGGQHDYWWQEKFDAVVVAGGHYHIPRFSPVRGLADFAETHPGVVEHSKMYRGPEKYRGKVSFETTLIGTLIGTY